MALTADQMIDRRQLKRKVTFWRIAALVILAGLVFALLQWSGVFKNYGERAAAHIAKVEIAGVITNDEPLLDLLETLKENDKVEAVMLVISSPGGSTVGGEAIYEAVRELAETKPVVTSVGSMAASAGYMIAAGTDHIVARRSSIVGSIGVIFQYVNATELLDKIGVKVDSIKSAPLKAEPSPFGPTSPEAKEMIDSLIQDSYKWFVDLVAERREFSPSQALQLADGSIFTGSQGLENGLIDAIGGENKAVEWLTSEKDVSENLKVIEWKPKRPQDAVFGQTRAVAWLAKALGLDFNNETKQLMDKLVPEKLFVDGLTSRLVNFNQQ